MRSSRRGSLPFRHRSRAESPQADSLFLCRNDITPDKTINWGNDRRDTVDNYVNSVDYFEKEDKNDRRIILTPVIKCHYFCKSDCRSFRKSTKRVNKSY